MVMNIDKEIMNLINLLITEDEQKSVKMLENNNEESIYMNPFEPLKDDGFIETRDHQLFVVNPKKNGRIPVLVLSKDLIITINGKKMIKDTPISEKDVIEWRINKNHSAFEITVSKDNMKVFLKLSPEIAKEYKLKDKRRSVRFMIEVEPVKKNYDVKQLYAAIIEEIQEKRIVAELKMDVIYQELTHPTFENVLIAEGIPMIESRDASLELLFSEKKEERLAEEQGRIDFRNRVIIPSVDVGDLIAILHPQIEGKHGINVYGKEITPKPPKQLSVRAKANVKIMDDGKVYALSKGRPTITGRTIKYIDILPVYEIHHDVDMKTGNIFFHGDVIVHGSVQENMRIESLGSVVIYGSVYSATVLSSQNIYVKDVVINSKLYAGSHGILYSQVYETAQNLERDIKKLIAAFNQITAAMNHQKVRKSYIFSILVEQKFKYILVEVRKLNEIISDIEGLKVTIPIQLKILQRILNTIFENKGSLLELDLSNTLESLLFAIKEVTSLCENSIHEDSNIDIGESDMSEIKTNGTITIRKRGAINSNIFAGEDCLIQGENAVVRGGKIHAIIQIIGGIIGSRGRDCPHLIANERIYVKELLHGKITMNHHSVIIEEPMKNVEFVMENSTNTIIYYSLDSKESSVLDYEEN